MKKVLKKVPVDKVVTKNEQKEIWIADDGVEFYTEEACSNYESKEKEKKILSQVKKAFCFVTDGETWLYASNDEELDVIKRHIRFYDTRANVFVNGKIAGTEWNYGSLKVGDWISYSVSDGGDYSKDCIYINTKDYVEMEFQDFLSETAAIEDEIRNN